MNLLVLGRDDVMRLLPMAECIAVIDGALRALAAGNAVQPLRNGVWLPDRTGLLGLMPGYLGEPAAFGLKVVSVMPGNHAIGRESHQGFVAIFDTKHGEPLAIMDAASITAIRTAAASGVATRALAREDAADLAILGSGVQARTHLDAMLAVRSLRRVRVWSRDPAKARRFADTAAKLKDADRSGAPFPAIEVAATPREAVIGADIVCTTTASREPILEGAWLAPGAHINAVGACFPSSRELDTPAVVRSRLYVDRRESAFAEAGDILIPKKEGAIGDDHIVGEIGELLLQKVPGRRTRDEITLFKSLGLAVEDLATAEFLYRKALQTGQGRTIPFGPDPA